MSSTWRTRGLAGLAAIAATIGVFWLWSLFGDEVMKAMDATSQPAPANTASDGAYVVNVLPAPKQCPKDKPC